MSSKMLAVLSEHKERVGGLVGAAFVLTFIIFILGVIFFGAGYNNAYRAKNLHVFCVNLDNSSSTVLAQAFLGLCKTVFETDTATTHPTLLTASYPNYEAVVEGVERGDCWGALVLQEGSGDMLLAQVASLFFSPVRSNNTTPVTAVSILIDEGRNQATVDGIVLPFLEGVTIGFINKFTAEFWGTAFTSSLSRTNVSEIAANIAFVTQPITYQLNNLHPTNIIGNVSITIGLIMMLVFSFMFLMIAHGLIHPLMYDLKTWGRRVFFMVSIMIFACFWISLGFSGSVAVYGAISNGHFIPYWMLNWLQMTVYMSSLGIVFPLLQEKLGLFFCFFLVLNITASGQNFELENHFYYWGYAAPFWHAASVARTELFGSYNRNYMHIPSLVGMLVFSMFIMLPFMVFLHQKVLAPRGMGFKLPEDDDDK